MPKWLVERCFNDDRNPMFNTHQGRLSHVDEFSINWDFRFETNSNSKCIYMKLEHSVSKKVETAECGMDPSKQKGLFPCWWKHKILKNQSMQ